MGQIKCKSIASEIYSETKLYTTSKTDFLYVKSNKMYLCIISIVVLPKIEHIIFTHIFLLNLGNIMLTE